MSKDYNYTNAIIYLHDAYIETASSHAEGPYRFVLCVPDGSKTLRFVLDDLRVEPVEPPKAKTASGGVKT